MSDDRFDEINVVGRASSIGFPKQTRVLVEARTLTIGSDAPILPSRIQRAYLVPHEGERPRVFVDVKRGFQIHIDVLTRAEGQRLLRSLGWAIDQRAITFTGKPTTWVLVVAALVWFFGVGRWATYLHGTMIFSALAWMAAAYWTARPRVDVGADGITIHQYFRRRFVSYRDIDRVRLYLDGTYETSGRSKFSHLLLLERDNRPTVSIRLESGDVVQPRVDGILDRVQTALDAFHGREHVDLPSELTRGSRPTKDWIASLRALASGMHRPTYRVATIDPERLLAVVESPTEAPSARAAAAVALARSATDEQRERLAKSTETVAEPHLRVALEAALKEDEEALEAAIHALESSESEQR